MPVSKQERRNRHESAEAPTLKRGNPSSSEGRVGTQQFRNIPGKGLVHMIRTEKGWNEMSTSQTSTTAGDKVDSVILTGSSGTSGGAGGITSGGTPKNITNSYTGSDTSVRDLVFVDTPSNAYIRGVRSQNNNLSITIVDSLDYGSYINFNAISGTGIESVQSYNEASSSYDAAVGANTNLKFASDYDSGASTGIFFTATDSGNDTILTPTILFPPDTNTTYSTSWVDSTDDVLLRLTPSSGSNDDLKLVAGSNIYLTPSGDNMTIAANNTTNYSLVNSTGNPNDSHTLVMTSSGTEGRLRALKPGNNITMTTTDTDSDTSYVTLNADLSGATINTSEVNPLGGYLTYSASNMRFLDGNGITWALANQGGGVIELTPTVTISDTNTQNTYTSSWVDSTDDVLLRLTGGGATSGTQDIKLVAGSNIYLTPSGADMTIAANNTTNYALTNSSSSGQQATLVTVNSGTAGKLRGFKQGSNITITSTDEGVEGNGYITIAASLSNATINASEVNPVGGYFTWDSADIRFIDNGGITWALGRPGSNVTTVTPSFTLPSHNHGATEITSGTIADARLPSDCGANTSYAASSHNHDSTYYTETEVDTSLALKSNLAGPTFTGTVSMPYLRISSTGDAAPGSTTHGFQVGATSSNVIIDNNEVMARASGVVSTLHLNADGGGVKFQSNSSGNEVEIDTSGNVMCKNLKASEDVWAYTSSDSSLKDNKKTIERPLDIISKIGGYSFDWNGKAASHLKGHDYGVMANEIESVMPELVTTRENGIKAVRYDGIIPLLIEAIKELKNEVSNGVCCCK